MIVVDVETTGSDSLKHSIVSMGALDFKNPKNQFYEECRIWEGAEVQKIALEINGFTEDDIRDPKKQSLETAVKKFISWTETCANKTLAGNNTSFDRDFIFASLRMYNLSNSFHHRTIDLHSVCVADHYRKRITLPIENGVIDLDTNKIFNYVGLPNEPEPHNALTGAMMEAEAFSRLFNRVYLLEKFENYTIPDHI